MVLVIFLMPEWQLKYSSASGETQSLLKNAWGGRWRVFQSDNDRAVEIGTDLWNLIYPNLWSIRATGVQGCIQIAFEYFQGGRLHQLPGQPVIVLAHSQQWKSVCCCSKGNFLFFSFYSSLICVHLHSISIMFSGLKIKKEWALGPFSSILKRRGRPDSSLVHWDNFHFKIA